MCSLENVKAEANSLENVVFVCFGGNRYKRPAGRCVVIDIIPRLGKPSHPHRDSLEYNDPALLEW